MASGLTTEDLRRLMDAGVINRKSPQKRRNPTYGTVSSVSPFQVILDGDTEALPYSPAKLFGHCVEGDRVYCVYTGNEILCVGVVEKEKVYDLRPYLSSSFQPYSDDFEDEGCPKIYVSGGLVSVSGAVKPKNDLQTSTSEAVFATLPDFARPKLYVCRRCQGSGINTWLLQIHTDGRMTVSRYGTTSYGTVTTSNWLPFSETYLPA